MSLFGSSRDISLFRKISRELTDKIIQQEIGLYKINLDSTVANIYGESSEKYYFQPIKLFCLIERDNPTYDYNEAGPEFNQNKTFRFLRDYLKEKDILLDVGDILYYDNRYWEVYNVIDNQFIAGKNDDNNLSTYNESFGENFSIIVQAHMTRTEKPNIEEFLR
jgi:hypothetical protein